jgi:hypothetical protein
VQRAYRAIGDALDEPRDSDFTEHTFLEMVRSRVRADLAVYEHRQVGADADHYRQAKHLDRDAYNVT